METFGFGLTRIPKMSIRIILSLFFIFSLSSASVHHEKSIHDFITEFLSISSNCKSEKLDNFKNFLSKIVGVDQKVGDNCNFELWDKFVQPVQHSMNSNSNDSIKTCDSVKAFANELDNRKMEEIELELCLSKTFALQCDEFDSKCVCLEVNEEHEHEDLQHKPEHTEHGHHHHHHKEHGIEKRHAEPGCKIIPFVPHEDGGSPPTNDQAKILPKWSLLILMPFLISLKQ